MAIDVDAFLHAQSSTHTAAMAELRAGKKRTHWMWWTFPIAAGLRPTAMARRYAIPSHDDARVYLREDTLRARLIEGIALVHAKVVVEGVPLEHLMGDEIDAQKLVWCCALFGPAALSLADVHPELLRMAAQMAELESSSSTT